VLVPFASQKLVAFLALRGEFVRRTFVAGSLWPETTDDRAHRCLRSTLWRIRCLGVPLLEVTPRRLRILPSVVLDTREQIESAYRSLDGSAAGPVDPSSLEGDLLPDWYDDWVVVERERLRQLRLHALEASAKRLLGDGKFADAIETLHVALRAEPLRESAHKILLETYLAEGNRGEALRHYREYRERLERRLGLQPGAELEHLVQRLTT
jgi:DNA-binding SARP family transcriptional activator